MSKRLTVVTIDQDKGQRYESVMCLIIDGDGVYTAQIHGFSKKKIGSVDSEGNIKLVIDNTKKI